MTTDEELRELVEKATPVPWEHMASSEHHGHFVEDGLGRTICDLYYLNAKTGAVVRHDPHGLSEDEANAALIVAAVNELPRHLDEIAKLKEVVGKCRDQFLFYAEQHTAKGTPDGDAKARTNTEFATLCAQALEGLGE